MSTFEERESENERQIAYLQRVQSKSKRYHLVVTFTYSFKSVLYYQRFTKTNIYDKCRITKYELERPKKIKKQTKRTNAIEISENTQEKKQNTYKICAATQEKHKTLRCKTGMLTFILI